MIVGAVLLGVAGLAAAPYQELELGFDGNKQVIRGLKIVSPKVTTRKAKAESGLFAGKEMPAWQASSSNGPANKGWLRVIDVESTQTSCNDGKHQALDVSVIWRMPATACLRIYVMTSDGFKRYTDIWAGGKDIWRETKVQIDDAVLRNGQPFLRIEGGNGVLSVYSLKVKVYNTTGEIDWGRMIRVADIRNNMPNDIQIYRRSADNRLDFELRNLTEISRTVNYRLTTGDYQNTVGVNRDGKIELTPLKMTPLEFALDMRKWSLGPATATLTLLDGNTQINSTPVRLGVISDTALDKARTGEFLYGLDAGAIDAEKSAPYYDLMGVDVTRTPVGIFGRVMDWQKIDAAMAFMQRQRLRSAYVMDPTINNPAQDEAASTFLRQYIAKYGGNGFGQVTFLEFGNEPDLPMFFNYKASEYPPAMLKMLKPCRDAIIANGLEGKVQLMNGGLSFAHDYGDRRSREILKCPEMKELDIIAYHGHGYGSEAERNAFLRVKKAAADAGIADKPFVETETGFSGVDDLGRRMQARTAVQKMVYVQSTGAIPTLYFFRLYFPNENPFEAGYGMTENDLRQPRPSVMAYRTMVEYLRHYRFVKTLDFAKTVGAVGVTGYLFAEVGPDSQPTGQKTLVMFCEKPLEHNLKVRLGKPGEKITAAALNDMFGNQVELAVNSGNTAAVTVDEDVLYLRWRDRGANDDIGVERPAINIGSRLTLPSGVDIPLPFRITNTTGKMQTLTVTLSGQARGQLRVAPSHFKLNLAPGQTERREVKLNCGFSAMPLAMPVCWRVFLDADPDRVADWSSIPETLASYDKKAGVPVTPIVMDMNNNGMLNFGKLKPHHEKRPAVGYAWLDATEDCRMPVAASADWWMAWYVNGKRVYSTLETGNNGSAALAGHKFELPLKKGRNLVAFQCRSGMSNWTLRGVGPKERMVENSSGKENPDFVAVELRDQNGVKLERQVVSLNRPDPVARAAEGEEKDGRLALVMPVCRITSDKVINRWVDKPDTSKWYGGKSDLSGEVWVIADAANVYVTALITDAEHCPTGADVNEPVDSIEVTALSAPGKILFRRLWSTATAGQADGLEYRAERRDDGTTLYRLTVPRNKFAQPAFRLAVTVFDNDGGKIGYRQKAVFGTPDKPEECAWVSLRP